MRFCQIEDQRDNWPVRVMCDALSVSPSGYYAWRSRPESRRKSVNRALLVDIQRVHARHRERYGAPRIHAALRAEGQTVGRKRIERMMRHHGIRARAPRRYRVCTTDSKHSLPVAPNLLDQVSRNGGGISGGHSFLISCQIGRLPGSSGSVRGDTSISLIISSSVGMAVPLYGSQRLGTGDWQSRQDDPRGQTKRSNPVPIGRIGSKERCPCGVRLGTFRRCRPNWRFPERPPVGPAPQCGCLGQRLKRSQIGMADRAGRDALGGRTSGPCVALTMRPAAAGDHGQTSG
jgi:transposase InsO family protein